MCFSLSTDKYNEKNDDHFILEDIEGALDFGEGTSRVYAQGGHYQILAMDGEYSQLVVNEYGRGHSVYFEVFRILPRTADFCFGQSIMQPAWNRR